MSPNGMIQLPRDTQFQYKGTRHPVVTSPPYNIHDPQTVSQCEKLQKQNGQ
ncbi:hypothetical protein E4U30_004316 [Claviceps sp. LM220 group G6]|nr:hypothetical protein E4U30_004316 [Claviceps sp. LM220 group G6]KAG6101682.1 hypothetical protein E4U31_003588 [Claviceps sp. LM219 group G6]KAG6106479.1 hypothetical protein E4U14_004584 [Claviceps sp. LM454 group G7]